MDPGGHQFRLLLTAAVLVWRRRPPASEEVADRSERPEQAGASG
jgi:hypothetical protein